MMMTRRRGGRRLSPQHIRDVVPGPRPDVLGDDDAVPLVEVAGTLPDGIGHALAARVAGRELVP